MTKFKDLDKDQRERLTCHNCIYRSDDAYAAVCRRFPPIWTNVGARYPTLERNVCGEYEDEQS